MIAEPRARRVQKTRRTGHLRLLAALCALPLIAAIATLPPIPAGAVPLPEAKPADTAPARIDDVPDLEVREIDREQFLLPRAKPTEPEVTPSQRRRAAVNRRLPMPSEEVEVVPEGTLCALVGDDVTIIEQATPKDPACVIAAPVFLAEAGETPSVDLKPQALLDCEQAQAFTDWVDKVAAPVAQKTFGSKLASLRVASSYMCRRRNNLPTGKLSEHAKGNAIDISAFILEDGREITVADGWKGARKERRFLRKVHKGACDRFTTVLGPDGDSYHQDHFHLDIGCHGRTCTYRICQ